MSKKIPERDGFAIPADGDGQPFGQKMFPLDGMTKYPVGMPIMVGAWMGCVAAAIGFPEVVAAFRKETGLDARQIRSIGTGLNVPDGQAPEVVLKWADFVTEHVWGCHPS